MSDNQNNFMPHAKTRPRSKVALLFLLVIAVSAGVAIGVSWHEAIEHSLGIHGHQTAAKDASSSSTEPKQLWTCSMHPQVIQDKPGICPICHMQLTPLKAGGGKSSGDSTTSAEQAGITVDPSIVQDMGVRTAKVVEGPLRQNIRAVGNLEEAEPNIHDVNLRVSGWIERLYANTEGMHVHQGSPLFDLYSPDLQVAIGELIAAAHARARMSESADEITRKTAATLYEASAQKLRLLGLSQEQIDSFTKMEKAPRTVTFTSPASGHLTQKMVVEGSAVKAGDKVLQIVDHQTLWINIQIYEQQLPFIKLGQDASAEIESLPDKPLHGKIIFIHPHIDMMTRTAMVRISVPNESLTLRPGMYATVRITSELASNAVLVPREAVIDTGEQQIAFLVREQGHFVPQKIKMGIASEDGLVQVLEGLKPGDQIVTSGQFLLDSESRLQEAVQKFIQQKGQPQAQATVAAVTTSTMPLRHSEMSMPEMSMIPTAKQLKASSFQSEKADGFYSAYMEVAAALGAAETKNLSLNLKPLQRATSELSKSLQDSDLKELAAKLADAVKALEGQPTDKQRELFKAVGDAVAALVDAIPPSQKIADKIYLMHCPMAPGYWLQRNDKIANPFYADSMKECGEIAKEITTQKAGTQ